MDSMALCKEIRKLVTGMNHTVGSGKPSRNSQGIHDYKLQPTPMPTNPVPVTPVNTTAVPHIPVASPLGGSDSSQGDNSAVQNTSSTDAPVSMPVATQD